MISISIDPRRRGPFRLKILPNGMYQIHQHAGPAFEGPKLKIFRKAVELGIYRPDLRVADSCMRQLGHDFAEFGIGGKFIFTGKTSKSKAA